MEPFTAFTLLAEPDAVTQKFVRINGHFPILIVVHENRGMIQVRA